MFNPFFSCSNFPDLHGARGLELSGSFWARRQFKTSSHSLCQMLSTSKKPFINQFRLNNYAGIIWCIIRNSKHMQENCNEFTDLLNLQTEKKQNFSDTFFILNYTTCSVYNLYKYSVPKTKLLVDSQYTFLVRSFSYLEVFLSPTWQHFVSEFSVMQ